MEQIVESWLDTNKDWFKKYALENLDLNLVEKWLQTNKKLICKCNLNDSASASSRSLELRSRSNTNLSVLVSSPIFQTMASLNSLLNEGQNMKQQQQEFRVSTLSPSAGRRSSCISHLDDIKINNPNPLSASSRIRCTNCIIHKRKLFNSNFSGCNEITVAAAAQKSESISLETHQNRVDTIIPIIVNSCSEEEDEQTTSDNKAAISTNVNSSLGLLKCLIKSKIKFQSNLKQHSSGFRVKKEINLNDTKLLLELIKDIISHELHLKVLVEKIVQNLKLLAHAQHAFFYFVCQNRQKLATFHKKSKKTNDQSSSLDDFDWEMPFGDSLLGKVATTGALVNVNNAVQDKQYFPSVDNPKQLSEVNAMLCMPIKNEAGEIIAVVQVVNKKSSSKAETTAVADDDQKETIISNQFDVKDILLINSYLPFCAIAIANSQTIDEYQYEYERNRALLEVLHDMFEEQTDLDRIIFRIMIKAQELLKCQRCSILINLEPNESVSDLDIDDTGDNAGGAAVTRRAFDLFQNGNRPSQRRHSVEDDDGSKISHRLANYVIGTGQKLNLSDAYSDTRFDPLVDSTWSFKTKCLLCLPIRNQSNRIIGCAQLTNRLDDEPFDENDEQLFEAFTIFCGLGINNTIIFNRLETSMAEKSVALEVLSYHTRAPQQELDKFVGMSNTSSAIARFIERDKLASYVFEDLSLTNDQMVLAAYEMFRQSGLMRSFQIERQVLFQWLLTVRKNYRNVEYHNWCHAFNVAQSMFAIFENSTKISKYLQDIEKLALIVGCLAHDLDHRGTNNLFQAETHSALSQLYGTMGTMEKHHFNHCIMILNTPGHNIFAHIKPRAYTLVISYIKEAILATDLQDHFHIRKKFEEAVKKEGPAVNWTEEPYATLLRKNLMTCCDLAAATKPWDSHRKVVDLVTREFFAQGDRERLELHKEPAEMMDARRSHELPRLQIGWLDNVISPLYFSVACLCDSFKEHLKRVEDNRKHWSRLYENSRASFSTGSRTLTDGENHSYV